MERVEAGKSHIGSGVGNHPLEIYAALFQWLKPFHKKYYKINDRIASIAIMLFHKRL